MTRTDVTIKVKGAKELRKKLRAMADDAEDMRSTHRAAAELVVAEAKRRAPSRSGALEAGIKPGVTKTKATVRSGSTGPSKKYAARQHWVQQRGRPGFEYVYQAVGKLGRDVVDLYHDRVDDLIDRLNRSGTRGSY